MVKVKNQHGEFEAKSVGRKTKREQWLKNIAYGVTKCNELNVKKLGEAFAIGATIHEACDYADISPQTYYNWIEKKPELLEYFNRMREKLPLKAKANIAEQIHNRDITLSRWLIERKQPEEYGETLKLSSSEETKGELPQEDKNLIDEFHKKLIDNRLRRSKEKSKEEKDS